MCSSMPPGCSTPPTTTPGCLFWNTKADDSRHRPRAACDDRVWRRRSDLQARRRGRHRSTPLHHAAGVVLLPAGDALALVRQKLILEPAALWGSLAGLVMFFAFYNFSRSLRTGSISTNAPIFRLSFTLTAALAIGFLHEPLTPTKLAGLGLALIAVLTLAGDAQVARRAGSSYGSMTRVLLATVAAGIGNLIYKVGLLAGSPPETLLATQAWVFCSLATLFVW